MVNYFDLFSYKCYYEVIKKIIPHQFTHQTTLKVAPPSQAICPCSWQCFC